jgi:FSR family fosmidomycin resistance protein-like MFS transporter
MGHLSADMNQGALSAMLPFIIKAHHFTYAKASALVLGCGVVSSVVQPIIGWLGDKYEAPICMCLGILISGVGMFMMGVFNTFPMLFACTMIMGFGIALFHPEGGRLANIVSGASKGTGIANFNVGGNLGFGVGPLIVAAAFPFFGMKGCFLFIIPEIIIAFLLFRKIHILKELSKRETARLKKAAGTIVRDNWFEFWKVTFVNACRAVVNRNCIVFIPLFWVAVFNKQPAEGALMVTCFTMFRAVGTYFGGRLGDRIGFKNDIVLAGSLLFLLLFGFLFTGNAVIAGCVIVTAAVVMSLAASPVIALSQSYLPHHLGSASGISLGLVVSAGSLVAPLFGMAGDKWNLRVVFMIICGVSLVSLVFSLFLKNDRQHPSNSPNR